MNERWKKGKMKEGKKTDKADLYLFKLFRTVLEK